MKALLRAGSIDSQKTKYVGKKKANAPEEGSFKNYSVVSWTSLDGWTLNRMDKLAFFQSSYSSSTL